MAAVRISLITPVLDRRAMIGAALESVRRQAVDCEHLVVDGGSSDGTQEAVAAAPGTRLIEAPGASIYEAINLGIGEARGAVIGLLNSDDQLADGALESVLAAFDAHPGTDIVHGRALTLTESGGAAAGADAEAAAPAGLSGVLLGVPAINAAFSARRVFERLGLFDTTLPIAADREWLARAHLAKLRITRIDQVLYVYHSHAQSLTIGGNKAAELAWVQEHLAFARRYLAEAELDRAARRLFARFHGKEVAHEAVLCLRARRLGACAAALARGFRARAAWPFDAAVPLMRILGRRLDGGAAGAGEGLAERP